MKGIVIYYSWKGQTEKLARAIADGLSISYRRLVEVKERRGIWGFITAAFDAAGGKCSELRDEDLDLELSAYDTVFIGCPVWASKPVPAVNTFLRDANLKGKKVVLFSTCMGSGTDQLFANFRKAVEKCGATVAGTFAARAAELATPGFDARVKEWTKGL